MLTRPLPRNRVITTRRVSAGIHGTPGATSRRPAWWTAEDWVAEVKATLRLHRGVCRTHHVEADTVLAVARGMAGYADYRTGRDCRPTNDRLVDDVQVSLSTIQRARRVLKALGFVVELVAGRSFMSYAERIAAWRRGSAHRRIAAEFALCSRRARPRRPQVRRAAVERDTPPSALQESLETHLRNTHLQATTEPRKAAPRPAPTQKVTTGGRRRADPRARRLAEGAQRRLGWLAGVSGHRLTPTLTRFALAGWTPRDIERAVKDALAARGWRVPARLDQPAAYLALLLREINPEDRPGALDAHIAATEAAQRRYQQQLLTGTPCAHGQPAGNIPSPQHGHLACPLCRSMPTSWP